MGLRDQILSAEDFKSETVTVPEWRDITLVMRELNVRDRGEAILAEIERVEVVNGYQFAPKLGSPTSAAWIVVKSAHDEQGQRVFEDDDVEALAQKSASVVDRLAKIVKDLTPGLGDDETASADDAEDESPNGFSEAGKESSATPPADDSLS